jgi:hypothetical protein
MSKELKKEIMAEINKTLRKNMSNARTVKGIEMDLPYEWNDLLLEDGSILRSYEKMGWKVRWFQKHAEGPGRGKLIKNWLQFWSDDFAKQVR